MRPNRGVKQIARGWAANCFTVPNRAIIDRRLIGLRTNKNPARVIWTRAGLFVKNPAIPTLALLVLPSALKA